jgi:hypothetical protein
MRMGCGKELLRKKYIKDKTLGSYAKNQRIHISGKV